MKEGYITDNCNMCYKKASLRLACINGKMMWLCNHCLHGNMLLQKQNGLHNVYA